MLCVGMLYVTEWCHMFDAYSIYYYSVLVLKNGYWDHRY